MTPAVHRAHVELAITSARAGDLRTVDAVLATLRDAMRRKQVLQILRRG